MRKVMKIVLIVLAVFFIIATLLPLLKYDQWWIRVFDFPRGQIAIAGILIVAAYFFFWNYRSAGEIAVMAALVLCVVWQGIQMFPYTRLAGVQVVETEEASPDTSLALLIANVLMDNRETERLLQFIDEYDPDIVLTVETDHWWEEQLRVLEDEYPHTVKAPIDNTYGMLLHSRLELIDPEIKYMLEEDIPSIHTRVRLASGDTLRFYGLHPKPPYPKEAKDTTERDAELLLVGREVENIDDPTVVAGDLNDVAWSHTTSLFQKVSGLLDPRIGRGMFNTFNAKNVLMRWPLDHVFHSEHFELIQIERLPAFGSDHFPVYIALSLQPEAPAEQETPEATPEEEQEADEQIEQATGEN